MTDERAGDPVRGSRPAPSGSDAGRAVTRTTGPASAPFRIPVAAPGHGGRRPTMVPLTRRRGPRLGLRPPGAALVTAPTTVAPRGSAEGTGTPSSGIPSPAASPPPSTRAPVDAVTLPAGRVPARLVTASPDPRAGDREPSEEGPAATATGPTVAPTAVATLAPPSTSAPRTLVPPLPVPPSPPVPPAGRGPAPLGAPPAPENPRPGRPAPSAQPPQQPPPAAQPPQQPPPATAFNAPPPAPPRAPAPPPAPAAAPAPPEGRAAAPEEADGAPEEPPEPEPAPAAAPAPPTRRPAAAQAREGEADWAATSAVLASVGARVATWRRRWTGPRVLRLLTATCAVLVVVACGLGWGAASWVEAAVRQIGALDPNSAAIQDAAAQVGDQNFLVVGSDSRAGAPASEDAGDTADVPGARTDTIMIVHVPRDRAGVTVVSFPRDLEITRPACERWDPVSGAYSTQVLPPTPRVKLNSAYAAGGPRCVTRAVQELSGLAVNRFLGVDFQGFQGMVDAVHGVPICVERPVNDSVLGPIVRQAGPTVLNGAQALDYVRARHVQGDPSSDYGRIQRQQRFLGALLRSVLSAGTLLDPGRLDGLVEAVSRSTFGENIGSDQLLTLAQSLSSVDPRTVSFVTVPTTGVANDRGNEVLRPGAERALFGAIIGEQPLPGAPGAPAPPPVPGAEPADVRLVDARSATGSSDDHEGSGRDRASSSDSRSRSGSDGPSASTVAGRLRADGFGVVTDDSGSSSGARGTTIRYSPDQAVTAQALADAVPDARLDPGTSGRGTLTLVLGDDFDGDIRSTSGPSGATPAAPVNPTITAADATCA